MLSNLVLLDTALSDGAKVTYLVLLHHARQAGSCFPGQGKLAIERGISERSVRSHLGELAVRGLITPERRGKAKTNLYWIESLEAVYGKNSSAQEDDRKKTAASDRKIIAAPTLELEKESLQKESGTLDVPRMPGDISPYPEIRRIAELTGDTKSIRRFAQLYGIAMDNKAGVLWDEALRSLKKRMTKREDPLKCPGAYFCSTLATLLLERGIPVPVGSKAEGEEVKAALASTFPEREAK